MYYSPCKDVQACNYRSETSEWDKTQTQLKNCFLWKQHDGPCVPQVGAEENFIHCSDFGPSRRKCASSSEGTKSIILSKHSCTAAPRCGPNTQRFSVGLIFCSSDILCISSVKSRGVQIPSTTPAPSGSWLDTEKVKRGQTNSSDTDFSSSYK